MEISAAQVKALREKTGVGMMDCKSALAKCNGDMDAAAEHLRKTGRDAAVKRGGRTAAEGLVEACILPGAKVGVLTEVNCETDFVARTDEFKTFTEGIARELADASSLPEGIVLLEKDFEIDRGGERQTIGELAREKSATLGENIVIRRFARFRKTAAGLLEAYIHPGGRVGVLLEVNCETDSVQGSDDFRVLVRDLAMQIAAAFPMVLKREDIDGGLVEKEREIYREMALAEKKPEKVIDKIVEGRLQKFYKEVVLLEQEFVRDQGGKKRTIEALLKEKARELGESVVIRRFARFQLGELSQVTGEENVGG